MLGGTDILALHASQTPDKPAVIDEDGRVVTYAQLNARVNRLYSALRSLGIGGGDRCIHVHHNCVEGFEIGHANRKLRAVSTPMNSRLRGPEIAYILNDSGARVIVAGPEFVTVMDEARGEVEDADSRHWLVLGPGPAPVGWRSYEELLASGSDEEPATPADPTGPTMVYTAGTTGHPKGAYRPDGFDVGVVFSWVQHLHLQSDDVHLLAGPGYHSAPAAFSGLQQLLGATVVVLHRFDPLKALQLIERHRVTTTFMAPILVRRILDLPVEVREAHDVSSMRVLIVAAAPFPGDLKRRAVSYFGDTVYEFYGATETGLVTLIGPEDLLRKPESCGRPLEGVEVLLLDENGDPVPPGQPGELWSRSKGTLGGYYNKPEATRRSLRDDGFFTVGDVAYQDAEGFIHICDRKIDMIISGGVNIYPAEIEAVLHTHPAVEDCAVIGVPDAEWGESVKAVVKLRPGMALPEDEVIGFLDQRLAHFKVPRSVDFVEDFPRDAAGKLLKRLIREPYWRAAGRSV